MSIQLERPFVVDDETGDFASLDPSACPQCKRPGAFREDSLPPLSIEARRRADDEARGRRDDEATRRRERALRWLYEFPRPAVGIARGAAAGGRDEAESEGEEMRHERMRIISGGDEDLSVVRYVGEDARDFVLRPSSNSEVLLRFSDHAAIGVPDLLSRSSGVVYYEITLVAESRPGGIRFGFSSADGMGIATSDRRCRSRVRSEEGVGDDARSWGFDDLTGKKVHGDECFGDDRMLPKWGPGNVIGLATNVDKGMVAVSVDGDWRLINGNGVKFEDELIKMGVYPCVSGKSATCGCNFGPDFRYSPPPDSVWDIWLKYEDDEWASLDGEAREAAVALGYTQRSWMGPMSNPIESKGWEELTVDERVAARTLGYDAEIWEQLTALWNREDEDDPDDDDDSSLSFFGSMTWNELPVDVRRAAETLGFDPSTWDNDDDGPLDEMLWEELTPYQRMAAIVLGYDEEAWNEDSDSSDSDSSGDNSENGLPFDAFSWVDLPRNAREAAERLGYTAESWDQDLEGLLDGTRWGDLNENQQFAATVLGYDESKWNNSIEHE